MRTLITGGTGFIGFRLACYSLDAGEQVRIVGRTNTAAEAANAARLAERGAEVLLASVTDPAAVRRAVEGIDVVYHLAAAQHEAGVPDRLFWEVNVDGTRHVLEASGAAGVRRLVHGSTIGVYGSTTREPADEQTPPRPENVYGVTKLAGERLVLDAANPVPSVVVRIAETYGPGDRRLLKLFRAIDRRAFVMVGDGTNLHHPVHVDDLVEGLRLAASVEPAVGSLVVLAGPDVLTTRRMAEIIARELGTTLRGVRVPVRPVLGLARLAEAAARPLGARPPLHPRRIDFFVKNFVFSPQRAKDLLGFVPRVGFERGVAETVAWYREHGHLGRSPAARGHGMPPGSSAMTPRTVRKVELTAKIEPFDSFWEAPDDLEKGYASFGRFYRRNYLRHLPGDRHARILVVSCGPGYFVNLLVREGYRNVLGIDSDPGKVAHARARRLPCEVAEAFPFLAERPETFDVIFCEQELNHLTKPEILAFLELCDRSLRPDGTLIVHVLNGANPVTGAEALAQNFDHYNTFTEYTLRQVLDYAGFERITVIPLDLYVFYTNPLNYVLMAASAVYTLAFRLSFMLYGKANRLFTKKIAGIARKAPQAVGPASGGAFVPVGEPR